MKNITNFICSLLITALVFAMPILFTLSIVLKWGFAAVLITGFSTVVAFLSAMVLIGVLLDCVIN